MDYKSLYSFPDLKPYFDGQKHHFYYKDCVELCNKFAPHSDGVYPEELIECRRPNEPEEVKEYRKKIWKAKTKPTFSKIVSSLSKIRRSSDWSIKYPDEQLTKIVEGESLEQYCEKDFPFFQSITNWVFSLLLKKYLTDPNAVVLIMPLETEGVPETQYLRPYPYIFDSCHVLEYEDGERVVLVNPEGCYYYTGRKQTAEKGKSFYIIDKTVIEKWDQVNSKGDYNITYSYQHSLETVPFFKIGAVIKEAEGSHFLYESRIEGILPDLDEALREYSDLQAAKVLHIFPERWEFTQNECSDCKGTGKRPNPGGEEQLTCARCTGRGYIAAGPYSKMLLRPQNNVEGAGNIPNPPAGYVEKDVEIVKLMEASVKQHIYDALASINFQFLEQTPLNQSGAAKEVDKEELNNTVHSIAEDLVRVMDRTYKLNAYYRYKNLYPFDEIDKMLPTIPVPEHYDLLSSQFMQEELGKAKNDKLNPVIISSMEVEYASKRFAEEPEVRDFLSLCLKLNPLPNISEDDKMSMLSNKGITLENYVVSSNIIEFVQRAIEEDKEFANKTLQEQKTKMLEYAKAQILENNPAQAIIANMNAA
jgi:hypothetical protein